MFESQFDDLIKLHFPDQQDIVHHLFTRYPDRKETFKAIVEKSAGDLSVLRELLKTWPDTDDIPVDRLQAASARLQEALARFFPERQADVMAVLNRYHGPNAAEIRVQFVEQSEGRFLDLLKAVDQALFPEPTDELPDDSPYMGVRSDEDTRIAELKAELLFEASLYVDTNLRRLIEWPDPEAVINALAHYQFGAAWHRTMVFYYIILNLKARDPQQVLELILLQKLGLRSYEETNQ